MGINNSLLKSIQTLIDRAINVAPFDKTRQSQVITNNNNGTYTVRLDGVLYNNVPSYPQVTNITPNTIVKTHLPSNQPNQMYIVPHIETITNLFYPIGSWYQTSLRPKLTSGETGKNMVDYFDPEEAWGGQWELLNEGVFLSSAGANHAVSTGTAEDGGSPYIQEHQHGFTNPTISINSNASVKEKTGLATNSTSKTLTGEFKIRGFGTSAGATSVTGASGIFKRGTTTGAVKGCANSGGDAGATPVDLDATHSHNIANHSHDMNQASYKATDGAVGNINTTGLQKGNAGNLPPYKNAYMWHRYA